MDKTRKYERLKWLLLTEGGILLISLLIFVQDIFRGDRSSLFAVLPFVVRILLQGSSMYLYLTSLHLHKYSVLLSSVCYAYCGYFLAESNPGNSLHAVFSGNPDGFLAIIREFSGILVLFPLILTGIEKWLEEEKAFLLILALCITCICSSYFFYCAGLLAAGYLTVRLHQRKEKSLPKLFHFICLEILACILCAYSLVSQTEAWEGLVSPLGKTPYEPDFSLFVPRFKLWFSAFARTLNNDLLGNPYSSLYLGYAEDYFQASVSFSAFFVTLAWSYYVREKAMRKKITSLLSLLFILTAFPVVSLVLSAFSGLQTLWMFLFPVMQALLTALALDSIWRKGGLGINILFQGMLLSLLGIFICLTALSIGLNDFTGYFRIYLMLSAKYILFIGILHIGLIFLCLGRHQASPHSLRRRPAFFCVGLFCLFAADILVNCRHLSGQTFALEAFSYNTSSANGPAPAGGNYGILISLCSAAFVLLFYILRRSGLLPYPFLSRTSGYPQKKDRLAQGAESSGTRPETSAIGNLPMVLAPLLRYLRSIGSKRTFKYALVLLFSLSYVLATLYLFPSKTFAGKQSRLPILIIGSLLCSIPVLHFLSDVKENTAVYQKRSSNIELCRIICMFLVVIHHYALHGGSFFIPEMNANKIYAMFLAPGGKLSYDCFLAISCWFLADQKFSTKRFIRTWLQVLFYTVTVSAAACFVAGSFGLEPPLTFAGWISTFLPLSGSSHSFAASYLALYLLTPFLAKMTEGLSMRQARWLMLVLFYLETGTQLVGSFTAYRNSLFSDLLLFILCYVIAFNLKRWPLKIMDNSRALLGIFAFAWAAMWMLEYAYTVSPNNQLLVFIEANMLSSSSVNNLIGGFALFFWFKNRRLNRPIPLINALASGTFGILLIHDHNFLRNLLWGYILNTTAWHNSGQLFLHSVTAALWICITCFAIDWLRRRFLERNVMKSKRLNAFCEKCDTIIR